MGELGAALVMGVGLDKDEPQGMMWLEKAAARNDNQATVTMATGIGTQADPAEGRRWLRKAADKGHAEAAQALKQLGG